MPQRKIFFINNAILTVFAYAHNGNLHWGGGEIRKEAALEIDYP